MSFLRMMEKLTLSMMIDRIVIKWKEENLSKTFFWTNKNIYTLYISIWICLLFNFLSYYISGRKNLTIISPTPLWRQRHDKSVRLVLPLIFPILRSSPWTPSNISDQSKFFWNFPVHFGPSQTRSNQSTTTPQRSRTAVQECRMISWELWVFQSGVVQ